MIGSPPAHEPHGAPCTDVPSTGTPVGAARWRALTTHARVLLLLDRRPDARLRDIADELDLSERFVARVIDELERDGYVTRRREGRRNRYTVRRDRPLPETPVVLTVADLSSGAA
jgi:DNA-binding transcriptional ArsR family regulator